MHILRTHTCERAREHTHVRVFNKVHSDGAAPCTTFIIFFGFQCGEGNLYNSLMLTGLFVSEGFANTQTHTLHTHTHTHTHTTHTHTHTHTHTTHTHTHSTHTHAHTLIMVFPKVLSGSAAALCTILSK